MQQTTHTQWVQWQGLRSCLSMRPLVSLIAHHKIALIISALFLGGLGATPIAHGQAVCGNTTSYSGCGDCPRVSTPRAACEQIMRGYFTDARIESIGNNYPFTCVIRGTDNAGRPGVRQEVVMIGWCPNGGRQGRPFSNQSGCSSQNLCLLDNTDPDGSDCPPGTRDAGFGTCSPFRPGNCPTGFDWVDGAEACVRSGCSGSRQCRGFYDANETRRKQDFNQNINDAINAGSGRDAAQEGGYAYGYDGGFRAANRANFRDCLRGHQCDIRTPRCFACGLF